VKARRASLSPVELIIDFTGEITERPIGVEPTTSGLGIKDSRGVALRKVTGLGLAPRSFKQSGVKLVRSTPELVGELPTVPQGRKAVNHGILRDTPRWKTVEGYAAFFIPSAIHNFR
jgi:hypothetical protein